MENGTLYYRQIILGALSNLAARRPRACLAVILVCAALLRFWGLNWDQDQHLHPDERFLTLVTAALDWPQSVAQYFDESSSPANPRNRGYAFYPYGILPLLMAKAVAAPLGLDGYGGLHLAGRGLSAALDVSCVLLLYLLASTLYRDRRIALLAALFYASTVTAIQHAHFFVVDPFANCFACAALLFLARYWRDGRRLDCLLAGVFFGLAVACKISLAPLALVALLVMVLRAPVALEPSAALGARLEASLFRFVLFIFAAAVVFRIAQPDAFRSASLLSFLPADRWLGNVEEGLRIASGEVDIPPGCQWVGRTALLFPWVNMTVWGTGILLGLTGWAGWLVAGYELVRQRAWEHSIPVTWVAVVFFHQGLAWIMTMRYFLPAYGCLAILAAWGLVRWMDRASADAGARPFLLRRATAAAVTACIAVGALLWAVAFVGIYSRPHTRVEASEWIYANVPHGSTIAVEHWDDSLPLPLGRNAYPDLYRGVQMTWYDPDSPAKLETALGWLEQADYIVLSSTRLVESIPRLPARYPMSSAYYEALLHGSLGFERIASFESEPTLLELSFSSRRAEEAFRVYDHPWVRIFRKTPRYSSERARDLLGDVAWSDIVQVTARQHHEAPSGLLLPPREKEPTSWSALFPNGGRRGWAAGLAWAAALAASGWTVWPYCFLACARLPDRGYALSKTLGLFLPAWLAWRAAGSGLGSLSPKGLALSFLLVAAGGFVLAYRQRAELKAFVRKSARLLAAEELVFWGAFAALCLLRATNPDLWHPHMGGEKPMDFAYLNALVRTETLPPENPWYAGSWINYYYFGFVPFAALIKQTGTAPEVGYNLALATLAAVSAVSVFTLVAALSQGASAGPRRRLAIGALGVLFVLGAGNLHQARRLGWDFLSGDCEPSRRELAAAVLSGGALPGAPSEWYFDASRAIRWRADEVQPITEFPFFTFLYGDLHAHLMGLPLLLAAMTLAVALARARGRGERLAGLVLAAWTLGASFATNTWDAPLCLLPIAAAVWRWFVCRPGAITQILIRVGAVAALTAWLFEPFLAWNAPSQGAFAMWQGPATPVSDFVTHFGLFLVAIGGFFWLRRVGSAGRPATLGRSLRLRIAVAAPVVALALLNGLLAAALLAGILLAAAEVLRRRSRNRELCALIAIGLSAALLPEIFVLEGDVGRMNTVFKLYFQAWIMLGVAAAAALAHAPPSPARRWFYGGVGLAGAAALLYPVTAVPARARDRFGPGAEKTLDGMRFLDRAVYDFNGHRLTLRHDLEAIEWLRANAAGAPVIAEANTQPHLYTWGNRISVYTGLPSIVGWDHHLRQQMGVLPTERIDRRIADVAVIYNTPDPRKAWSLLRAHGAQYIVVGGLERALYARQGILKFDEGAGRFWERAFTGEGARIYRVLPASRAQQQPPRES